MTMTAPPAKTAISDVYPNPTNAVARTGFGALWDYVTGLLGSTGFTSGMLSASKILDPQALYNVSLVPSVAGNALTMKLTSADGATVLAAGNPATVSQRSSTLASGTYNTRNITADITTVISSGSTAGHSSGVAGYLYWYLIDNAGTQELAWASKNFGAEGIVSTTAEGGAGAADSATTMYSTTARSNVPFRLVGRSTDTQATAGTWTAVPTSIELLSTPVYEEGVWTPGMTFGGSSAGVTYSQQVGQYIKVGNVVHINFAMTLSSKGGLTTAAVMTGLPYSAFQTNVLPIFINWQTMTTAMVNMCGLVTTSAGMNICGIAAASATGMLQLSGTDFANTTRLAGTGSFITG